MGKVPHDELRVRGLETLIEVAKALRGVDIRAYEEASAEVIRTALLPGMVDKLTRGGRLLGELCDTWESISQVDGSVTPDSPRNPQADDVLGELDAVVSTTDDDIHRRLADIAFLARLELKRRIGQLETGWDAMASWDLIYHCDRCRRGLLKAVMAVETVIWEHDPAGDSPPYITEVDVGLVIRREYRKVRAAVDPEYTPEDAAVRRRLRHVGVALARLIGKEIYPDLRTEDRRQIRELQRRVVAWLSTREGADVRDGRRIWQDAAAFADLLRHVNNRTELREHDTAILRRLGQEIDAQKGALSDRFSSAGWEAARTLLGRDDALDALIDAEAPLERWRMEIPRVLRGLQPAPQHTGAADSFGTSPFH